MEGATTGVSDAVVSGLTTVAGEMSGMITSVLPVALGIVGAIMAVTFGIKFFRKITGK